MACRIGTIDGGAEVTNGVVEREPCEEQHFGLFCHVAAGFIARDTSACGGDSVVMTTVDGLRDGGLLWLEQWSAERGGATPHNLAVPDHPFCNRLKRKVGNAVGLRRTSGRGVLRLRQRRRWTRLVALAC